MAAEALVSPGPLLKPVKAHLAGNWTSSPASCAPRQPQASAPRPEDSTLCKIPAKLLSGAQASG